MLRSLFPYGRHVSVFRLHVTTGNLVTLPLAADRAALAGSTPLTCTQVCSSFRLRSWDEAIWDSRDRGRSRLSWEDCRDRALLLSDDSLDPDFEERSVLLSRDDSREPAALRCS